MQIDKPGYFAIIPADVRYDERLRANAKLFYAEISALSNKRGYCSASNEYFAGLFGLSGKTVSQLVSQLVELGYIHRAVLRDKRGAVLERRLWLKNVAKDTPEEGQNPSLKNVDTSPKNRLDTPPKNAALLKENTTRENTPPIVPGGDEQQPTYQPKEVCTLYNTLCTTLPHCTRLTDKRLRAVVKLRQAGYTLEQLSDAFTHVARSTFCTGQNDRRWRADFDWLMNENNLVKVLEGKYDDQPRTKAPSGGGYSLL